MACFLFGKIAFVSDSSAATSATISITLGTLADVSVAPGIFGSAAQTVTVATDNYTGSSTTLASIDDSTALVNTLDNNLTIPTITLPSGQSSITSSEFISGYGVSRDGMNFAPAPAASSSFLIGNSATAGTAVNTVTFGVKPAQNTNTGTYSRTFVVMAVANSPQYSITYNANAGTDTVTNMPNNQATSISDTGIITLSNVVPSRAGYVFLGWDEENTSTTPTYPVGSTNTIALDPTAANGIIVYAVWRPVYNITYQNLTNNSFPPSINSGETLSITIVDNNVIGFTITMNGITLTENTDYTYQNNTLTIPNVSGNLNIAAIIDEPVIADYTEEFAATTNPTASVTTQLNNMSPADFITKIFAYSNNTGRTISSITVQIVYSKSNQGATSGSLIGKLNYNGTTYTAAPVSVARNKVTNQTVELAQFNNLNIPSSSNISFTIGTDSDAFTAGITISSQTVTVTFAD